jgi:hypothetical protein
MGNLQSHVRNVLVDKIQSKTLLVHVIEHAILDHVFQNIGLVANTLGKIVAHRLQKTNICSVVVPVYFVSRDDVSSEGESPTFEAACQYLPAYHVWQRLGYVHWSRLILEEPRMRPSRADGGNATMCQPFLAR